MSDTYEFVVVANRLPVDENVADDGSRTWTRSPGGLVSALQPIVRSHGGAWVGWTGQPGDAPEPFDTDGMHLHPVGLSADDVDHYYAGQSNGTIWPLFHAAVEQPTAGGRAGHGGSSGSAATLPTRLPGAPPPS